MKVRAVCPACGRPASSRGRSECLYCGAPLASVATGTVSAAGSGTPVAERPEGLKAPAPPATRAPKPSWMSYEEEERPLARLLESGWVRLFLAVAFVLAGVLAIARLIEDHRPPGFVQEPLPK